MRTAWTIAGKDLVQLSRDRLGTFFIIGFPVAMAFFFGIIGASMQSDSARLVVAIADEDDSSASRELVATLADNEQVEVVRLPRDEAVEKVRRGSLMGVVVIPSGFGRSAGLLWLDPPHLELGVDPSRKAEAGMLQGLVFQAMGRVTMSRLTDPESFRSVLVDARRRFDEDPDVPRAIRPLVLGMWEAAEQLLDAAKHERERRDANAAESDSAGPNLADLRLVEFDSIDVTQRDPQRTLLAKVRSPWDLSFPQAMIWAMLGCVAGFAISIVREKTRGTWDRLRLAPVSLATIVAGKSLACFLAVVTVIALLTVLGLCVGLRPRSPGLLVVAAVSNAVCFVGLMIAMSSFGRTEESVSGAVWGVNLLMAMFGGGMIPLAFLPEFMKQAAHASPVKWGVLAIEGAVWRGFTPSEMLLPCGMLIAIGVVAFGWGARVLCRE